MTDYAVNLADIITQEYYGPLVRMLLKPHLSGEPFIVGKRRFDDVYVLLGTDQAQTEAILDTLWRNIPWFRAVKREATAWKRINSKRFLGRPA